MDYTHLRQMAERIETECGKIVIGKQEQIRLILTGLLAGGHVLIDDIPGVGKTTLVKTRSAVLGLRMVRVQFTPDLLPSDITGARIYDQKNSQFTFLKGPAFTNILLADEINRATPRTQSALLECMEERQISEGGVTYKLEEPFLVIATQNPVETQGTFPLPEAQLDRFLIRISLGYPTTEEAVSLLQRFMDAQPLAQLSEVADAQQVVEAAQLCRSCRVSEDVMRYMAALCEAARDPGQVRLGPSPRALLALMRCCQALAAVRGRDYVIPDDVKLLAVPVLAHRILMKGLRSEAGSEAFVRGLLQSVSVPTESRA